MVLCETVTPSLRKAANKFLAALNREFSRSQSITVREVQNLPDAMKYRRQSIARAGPRQRIKSQMAKAVAKQRVEDLGLRRCRAFEESIHTLESTRSVFIPHGLGVDPPDQFAAEPADLCCL